LFFHECIFTGLDVPYPREHYLYKVHAMITLIFGRHRQWAHVCGSTDKKADQVMIRFASGLAEAQQ
jgi:hypothetical protein